MSDHHPKGAASVLKWSRGIVRIGALMLGMAWLSLVSGTLGYFARNVVVHSTRLSPEWGRLIVQEARGYVDFCAVSFYVLCLALLARPSAGRRARAIAAWMVMASAGVMIAEINVTVPHALGRYFLAGAAGGLAAGLPIALSIEFVEPRTELKDRLGPTRFSLATLLWMVAGCALLFGGLSLRANYYRRRDGDVAVEFQQWRDHHQERRQSPPPPPAHR